MDYSLSKLSQNYFDSGEQNNNTKRTTPHIGAVYLMLSCCAPRDVKHKLLAFYKVQ